MQSENTVTVVRSHGTRSGAFDLCLPEHVN